MNYEGQQKALEPLPPQAIPSYLQETYWWAYVHPNAVSFFERQWLVNLILWGNFARLRDAALAELGGEVRGRTLQVACVYGNFTEHLARRVAPGGSLAIVDVLPIQLRNLRQKLPLSAPVSLHRYDSTALGFEDASYDQAILFFLLHEQPAAARVAAMAAREREAGTDTQGNLLWRPVPEAGNHGVAYWRAASRPIERGLTLIKCAGADKRTFIV